MPDYLLAAHIQVTGGVEAAASFQLVQTQINNFTSAAKNAGTGQMAGDFEKAAQSGSTFSNVMDRVGSSLIRMGTYQGISLVEGGLRMAASAVLDFDSAMTNSLSIQTGVTEQMRSDMEHLAETIAVKLGEAPAEVAKGFYFLASAGLTVDQQMADLPVVANFAKAGLMNLDQATEMLFDSLTALGLKVDDPAQQMQNLTLVADLLTEAAIRSQGEINDFGAALANKAGADIKSYGVNLQEGIALLEVFADRGLKGAKAGTAFDQVIRDLTIKATQHADAFKRLGIEVFDSQGNFNDLVTIFQQVDAALGKMPLEQRTEALKEMGFTLRSGQLIQSLLGTSGALAAFTADLQNAGGTAQEVAEKQMESLRAKLDQLKSVTMVWSIEGFGKLEEAAAWLVAVFSPAVSAVVEALGHLLHGAEPIAGALAKLVAVGVVEGLQGIALAVETVFSVINAHPGVVEALGAALAGIAAAQIGSAIAGIAVSLGETLYLKALYAKEAVGGLVTEMVTLAKTEDMWTAMKAGVAGLAEMINPVTVALAAVAVAGWESKRMFDEGADSEHKFFDALAQRYDEKSLSGLNNALTEAQGHVTAVNKAAESKVFDSWVDVGAVKVANGEFKDLNERFGNAYIGAHLLQAVLEDGSVPLGEWADDLKRVGLNIDDMHIATVLPQIRDMAAASGLAGQAVGDIVPELEAIARANNIDMGKPIGEWLPKLEAAYIQIHQVRIVTGDLGGVVEGTVGKLSSFEKAIATLGDEGATTEDKMKALKTVIDGLDNGMVDWFNSTTKYATAMGELGTALGGSVPTFDASTEAGRKQRDAFAGAAQAAKDMAVAHATATGSVEAGGEALVGYSAHLTGMLVSAGVGNDKIRELLGTMGLTPAQIQTVFEVSENPKNMTADMKAGFDDAATSAGDAAFQIDMVKGALDRLKGPISDLQAQNNLAKGLLDLGEAAANYVTKTGPLNDAWSTNSKEADGLKDSLYGTAQAQIAYAQSLADQPGRLEEGIQGLRNYKSSISDMMGALGMTQPQIDAVLAKLGLTDDAINALKPGVVVPVSETGAKEVAGKLDFTANPNGQARVANVQATPTNVDPATAALNAVAAPYGAARDAIMHAKSFNVPLTTAELDNVAYPGGTARTAAMWAYGANVEGTFGQLNMVANPGNSARQAVMWALAASGPIGYAEAQLNNLARTRTAYIDVAVRNMQASADLNAAAGNVPAYPNAQGGLYPSINAYASGGFENHVAQIAWGNAPLRLWAEPETGGEAYIPLAPGKRARSMQIWEEAGRMMGVRPGGPVVNISAPVSVSVDGSQSPTATAQAVATQVESSLAAFTRRLVTELQAR